jgi:pyridoxine/pyridoxamine 5'-phosphate oxidase
VPAPLVTLTNPQVAILFWWPEHGRQVQLTGVARLGPRALAEQLFDARPPAHRLQAVVSRQGSAIEDLAPLRRRLSERLAP